jgi:hypothetical protein
MADMATRLDQARELHLQSRWAEACKEFAAADRIKPLGVQDLELFAEAEQVLGRGDEAVQTLRRAYRARIEAGEVDQAITSAFWLWQALIINAEFARANGWVAQVRRLADKRTADEGPADEDSPTPIDGNGWLLVADAYSHVAAADYDRAVHLVARAAEAATRRGQTRSGRVRHHALGSGSGQGRTTPGRPQPTRRGDVGGHRPRHLAADDQPALLQRDRHLSRGPRIRQGPGVDACPGRVARFAPRTRRCLLRQLPDLPVLSDVPVR